MSDNKKKIRCVVIDTATQIQENQYMADRKKPGHDDWKDYGQDLFNFFTVLQELGFEFILVIGPPGTGKSSGMRTLEPGTAVLFNADKKNPTWIGGREVFGSKTKPNFPYHQLPNSYQDIINSIAEGIKAGAFEEERFAFVLGHTENYKEGMETRVRLKTMGKLNNKMQVEGKMETVLYSSVSMENGVPNYLLETQNNGYNTARSHMGMFEGKIPNDYKFILDRMLGLTDKTHPDNV